MENSLFGKLIKEGNQIDQQRLLQGSRIKSLKIFRKRVEGSGEVGSTPYKKAGESSSLPKLNFDPIKKPKLFEENQLPELIVESRDEHTTGAPQLVKVIPMKRPPPLPLVPLESVSTPDLTGASIEEKTNFGNLNADLRHFNGVDGFVKKETDGYYKYEVEIECFDKSVILVEGKHKALLRHINVIKTYYEQAIRLSRAGGAAPWISPYIDVSGEKDFEPGQIKAGSFDSRTNRFTTNFRNLYTDGGGQLSGQHGQPIADAISKESVPSPGFVQILRFFSKIAPSTAEAAGFEASQITNALLDYVNPFSATPESINTVLQLMETVASKISSILGVVYERQMGVVNTNTNAEGAVVKRHVAAKNRTFKVKYESSSFFDANLKRNLGFDFLDTTDVLRPWQKINHSSGLYEINSDYLQQQATYERNKFFPVGVPQLRSPRPGQVLNLDTTFGTYFTPHVIVLPGAGTNENVRTTPDPARPVKTGPDVFTNFDKNEFLKVVSYSLCRRQQRTDPEWIRKIIEALWGTGKWNPNLALQMSLVNDLAAYFHSYHNSVITSPENEQLWGVRAAISAQNRTDSNPPSYYYISQRANDQDRRAEMYGSYMEMIDTIEFNPEKKKEVSEPHMVKRDTALWNVNKPIGPTVFGLYKQLEGYVASAGDEQSYLQNSPIQIKALMEWSEFSTPQLDGPFLDDIISNIGDQDIGPAFEYTTQIINRIEVLTGYEIEMDTQGVPTGIQMLNKPIWQPLHSVFTSGQPLANKYLCRSVPCEDKKYLITRNKNYDLPTYDEYFIFTPPQTTSLAVPPIGP